MINHIFQVPHKFIRRIISPDVEHASLSGTNISAIKPLENDVFVPLSKINLLKSKLDKVLTSPECPKPDISSFIPQNATDTEQQKILEELFQQSKFFTRIAYNERKYGKNFEFGKLAYETSKNAQKSISQGKDLRTVLDEIAQNYSKETEINTSATSRIGKSGIYRGNNEPIQWLDEDEGIRKGRFTTGYGAFWQNNERKFAYKEYYDRFRAPQFNRKSPYQGFTLTTVDRPSYVLVHPYPDEVEKNMEFIDKKYKDYNKLVKEYQRHGFLNDDQKRYADNVISEIYYLMSNTCPFKRGSNGISDIFMRASYSALGIDKPHVRNGVGLDLEAFCMNLDEYKSNWNNFFE